MKNMAKLLFTDEVNFITGNKFDVDDDLASRMSNSLVGALPDD